MEVRFVKDPDTELPHIARHGVSELEVLQVLDSWPTLMLGRDNAIIALGRTTAGRYLKVIYRRIEDGILVITAYDLRGKELKAYRRRIRHRPR